MLSMIELLQQWEVLLVPLVVLIISQLIKVLFTGKPAGSRWQQLNSYGGMPSTHTALFVSLTLVIGLTEGFRSPIFFLSAFVAAVFIRDAVGIRQYLGLHSTVLKQYLNSLPKEAQTILPERMKERLGHTSAEAAVGAALGAVLTVILHVIIHL
jgi:hypothetical protein